MKFVFAPDSMKGSLSAMLEVECLTEAAKKVFPDAECIGIPVADGGEGTVDALATACGGEYRQVTVQDPLGRPVQAKLALVDGGKIAVVEMAQACGLPYMNGRPDPYTASSFGLGEMLLAAAESGAEQVWVGIGGSATNDGGMGMLSALGAKWYDSNGNVLKGSGADLLRVADADLSELNYPLPIRVICDVKNKLLGENGATAVYGPQKGVTEDLFERFEAGMRRYAALLKQKTGHDVSDFEGAGAAGGVGAALGGVLNATLCPGIDAVLEITRFDEKLKDCDLVVTGEGRIDGQSVRFGKVPAGVAQRCAQQDVPVIALVGSIGEGAEAFYDFGRVSIMTICEGPATLDESMEHAEYYYKKAAERLMRAVAAIRSV